MGPLTPSLIASGGWCAPSDQLYSFLPDEPDSLITVARGGIQFTKGPDLDPDDVSDIWDDEPSMACTDPNCTHHNTIPTDAASADRDSPASL